MAAGVSMPHRDTLLHVAGKKLYDALREPNKKILHSSENRFSILATFTTHEAVVVSGTKMSRGMALVIPTIVLVTSWGVLWAYSLDTQAPRIFDNALIAGSGVLLAVVAVVALFLWSARDGRTTRHDSTRRSVEQQFPGQRFIL